MGTSLRDWLTELTISATALNLHACFIIGAALAFCIRKAAAAVLCGMAMTGLIELSQLTGFFGIYGCVWRQFDLDDLILNTAGVAIGFTVARFAGIRPRHGAKTDTIR